MKKTIYVAVEETDIEEVYFSTKIHNVEKALIEIEGKFYRLKSTEVSEGLALSKEVERLKALCRSDFEDHEEDRSTFRNQGKYEGIEFAMEILFPIIAERDERIRELEDKLETTVDFGLKCDVCNCHPNPVIRTSKGLFCMDHVQY